MNEGKEKIFVDIIVDLKKFYKQLIDASKHADEWSKKLTKKVNSNLQGISRDLEKVAGNVRSANEQIKKGIRGIRTDVLSRKFKREHKEIKKTFDQNVADLKKMYRKMLATEKDFEKRSTIREKFRKDLDAIRSATKKQQGAINNLSFNKLKESLGGITSGFNQLGEQVGYLSSWLWRFGDRFTTGILGTVKPGVAALATAFIGLGKAIISTVNKGIEAFKEFEGAIKSVGTLATDPALQMR